MASKKNAAQVTKVALVGFGTVGSGVARVLDAQKFAGIQLTHIFNRDVKRKKKGPNAKLVPASVSWTEKIDDVLNSDVDVVIELMGGLDPAEQWIRRALESGKSVITANKQLIAYRGGALLDLAAKHGVQLVYGAAVAGGVPVIPGILQGMGGDQITRLSGIVNGTCNFILSKMEGGADYGEVLKEAQGLGYAESDPSADVDGYDARAKLCILARIAMHAELKPESVATQTISTIAAVDFAYAKEMNCTIRQVSRVEIDGDKVRARVSPMLVPQSSPIAWSHDTQNMVVASGRFDGDVVFSGRGAGSNPTAVAVVSDLLAVSQRSHQVALPVKKYPVSGDFMMRHYLRFVVDDRPGIVSAISGALAKVGANIDTILQRRGYPKDRLPFVVTTEPCLTSTLEKALKPISKMKCMLEKPLCLPVLEMEE